jgi:hypothetical protein
VAALLAERDPRAFAVLDVKGIGDQQTGSSRLKPVGDYSNKKMADWPSAARRTHWNPCESGARPLFLLLVKGAGLDPIRSRSAACGWMGELPKRRVGIGESKRKFRLNR